MGAKIAVSIPRPATAGMVVFFLTAAYSENDVARVNAIHGNSPVCKVITATPATAIDTASHWIACNLS